MSMTSDSVFDREKEILYHEGIGRGFEKGVLEVLEWMEKDTSRSVEKFGAKELANKFLREQRIR